MNIKYFPQSDITIEEMAKCQAFLIWLDKNSMINYGYDNRGRPSSIVLMDWASIPGDIKGQFRKFDK